MSDRYNIGLFVDPVADRDFSHFEVYRSPELPIIGVNTGTKTFTIEGKFGSWYDVGDELEITLSTGNNGDYTVAGVIELTENTQITVTEVIPSAVADGLIKQKLLKQLAIKTSSTSFEDKGLPGGYFYYVIYAVDKAENYSDPSNIIVKSAPEVLIPPAQPTGLNIRRTDDLLDMELFWNANIEEDLKGYLIYRSFDGLTYDIIANLGSTSNHYKDTRIPPKVDTDSNTTPVMYAVSAINKYFLESVPAGPTTPLEVPILTGLRAIIDYLALNVYWNFNKPEDGITGYEVYYREVGTVPWVLSGTVDYPGMNHRIAGPLTKNKTYEVAIVVLPYTGGVPYLQPLPIPITIPNYEEDTLRPTSPEFLEGDLDPESNRIFLSWKRAKVDDDFLHYELWWGRLFDIIGVNQGTKTFTITGNQHDFFTDGEYLQVAGSTGNNWNYTIKSAVSGSVPNTFEIEVNETIPSAVADGMLFQLILDGITTQNNYQFRNMRKYFAREESPVNRMFVLAVTAIDRAGNQSPLISTSYLFEYWISQDMLGPSWIDVVRSISSSLFNDHDGSVAVYCEYAQFYLQWNDAGRSGKYFRRYIVYESVDLDPSTGQPVFDFDDETQIRGYSSDNTFTVQNNGLIRGFSTTSAERTIVAQNPGAKTFYVLGDQRGHFRAGNRVKITGSTGYDGTYTVSTTSYSSPQTAIVVVEVVPAGAGGNIYDIYLDKTKWYAVLSEDWFGDKFAATPTWPILEVK